MNPYYTSASQLSCSQPHPSSYLASLEFLELFCHIGSVINLIISSYCLLLIIKKSPPVMKSAVPFMINLAASTMICDFTWSVIIVPMFFMPLIAAHSSGVVSWFETNPKIIIWLAFGTLGGQSVAILLLFEQRHRVIVTDSQFVIKKNSTKYLFYFALYAYFLNFGAPEILTAPEDQELAKRESLQLVPCPPEVYFTNHSMVFQSDASLFNPHMYLTCLIGGSITTFYIVHVLWHLRPQNNPSMSTATRRMFKNFFFSVVLQASIPFTVVMIPNIYWNISITFSFYSQGIGCSFALLFEQRHRSFVTDSRFVIKRKSTLYIFYFLMYGYQLNFGLPEILTAPEDQESAKLQGLKTVPCPPEAYFSKKSFMYQTDASLFVPHMHMTLTIQSLLVNFYFFHILWHLRPQNTPSMSAATRKMYLSFLYSISIQGIIPSIIIVVPCFYWNTCATFKFYSQEVNNLTIVTFTLHGTATSIATIYLYAPYRNFTKELILHRILMIPKRKETVLVNIPNSRAT